MHCYGQIAFQDDPTELRDHVSRLTAAHESLRPAPWSVSHAPPDYIDMMLRAIVGFRLTITGIEGKWKLSQNREPKDAVAVREALLAAGGDSNRDVATLMKTVPGR